jgi:hypothetical protein
MLAYFLNNDDFLRFSIGTESSSFFLFFFCFFDIDFKRPRELLLECQLHDLKFPLSAEQTSRKDELRGRFSEINEVLFCILLLLASIIDLVSFNFSTCLLIKFGDLPKKL